MDSRLARTLGLNSSFMADTEAERSGMEGRKPLMMFVFVLKWAGIIFGGWLALSIGVTAIYAAMNYGGRRREEEFFRWLTHEKRSSAVSSRMFGEDRDAEDRDVEDRDMAELVSESRR
jgi:hypothetical protein